MSPKIYAAWFFVAIAYMLAFMQRMAPQSINHQLMADFHVAATGVSVIASGYFWGYTLMQIPAGPLVDRFGLRRMIIVSTLVSAVGCALFADSRNTSAAFFARFILACGDALIFTSLLKLVSLYFADGKFGFLSGLSQASGYVGGAIAAAPLAWLVDNFGWHSSFYLIAVVQLIVFAGCYLCVEQKARTETSIRISDLLDAVRETIRSRSFLAIVAINASHFAIVTTLAGVWGIPMVAHYFGIETTVAGASFVVFMIGNIVGSIIVGQIVDHTRSVPRLLGWLFLIRVVGLALLVPATARALGFFWITVDLFVIGFVSGGAIPAILLTVRRIFTVSYVSTGASICMTIAGMFTALLLVLVGSAMSGGSPHAVLDKSGLALTDHAFVILIAMLEMVAMLGLVGVLLLAAEAQTVALAKVRSARN